MIHATYTHAILGSVVSCNNGRSLTYSLFHPIPQRIPHVTAHGKRGVTIFDARTISRFYADNKYVCFVHQGSEWLLDGTLTDLEKSLTPHGFVQIRRNILVNLRHLQCIYRENRQVVVVMRDGATMPVSRRRMRHFALHLACNVANRARIPRAMTRRFAEIAVRNTTGTRRIK